MLQTQDSSQVESKFVSNVDASVHHNQANNDSGRSLHSLGLKLVLDSLAYGIWIVDAQRHVHYVNPIAQQANKLARCLILKDNSLQAVHKPDQLALEMSIKKATQHSSNGQSNAVRSVLRLRVVDTRPPTDVLLLVTPLHGIESGFPVNKYYENSSDSGNQYNGLAAIQLQKPTIIDPAMLCLFARSYKLTNTEEMVLNLLCDGLDAPEVATTLNVAVSTIRTHVRNLCEKLQANSIRQLIIRVALLPGAAGVTGIV